MYYNIKKRDMSKYNTFYSMCRNVKNFTMDDTDKFNELIENLREKFKKDNNGDYYYNTIGILKNKIFNNNIGKEEALFVLVNVIDPNLNMYKIYQSYCNKKIIIKKIKEEFNFYDDKFLEIEKIYINKFCDIDEFSFEKKLELKF